MPSFQLFSLHFDNSDVNKMN